MNNKISIYTDGGCRGNKRGKDNIGGWAAILTYKSHKKEIYGSEKNTTNNRMELTAVIRSFETLRLPGQKIEIHSDSAYLVNAFTKGWLDAWRKNEWKNSAKEPVENRDLWETLLKLTNGHRISFAKIKGHVNTNASEHTLEQHYSAFLETNGSNFTRKEFMTSLEMNNRADELVNQAMDEVEKL